MNPRVPIHCFEHTLENSVTKKLILITTHCPPDERLMALKSETILHSIDARIDGDKTMNGRYKKIIN